MPTTCTNCGNDQQPIHWRDYCHACCLHKPAYTQHLEGEVKQLQANLETANKLIQADRTVIQDDAKKIERLQAIVDCCAAECRPNESLEVNERVALLADENEQLRDKISESIRLLASKARIVDWGREEAFAVLKAAEVAKERIETTDTPHDAEVEASDARS